MISGSSGSKSGGVGISGGDGGAGLSGVGVTVTNSGV